MQRICGGEGRMTEWAGKLRLRVRGDGLFSDHSVAG